MRDIEKDPYSKDEARVAKFFSDAGTGGGDDPIGSILASHAYAMAERNRFRTALLEIVRVRDEELNGMNGARLATIARRALSGEL
jgi:hypothetical protein